MDLNCGCWSRGVLIGAFVLVLAGCSSAGNPAGTVSPATSTSAVGQEPTAAITATKPAAQPTAGGGAPTPAAEATQPQISGPSPLPSMKMDDQLQFAELDMVTDQVGWAVAAWPDPDRLNRSYHVLRTDDGGQTWLERTPPLQADPGQEVAYQAYIEAVTQDRAWVILSSGAQAFIDGVWITEDAGSNWIEAPLVSRTPGGIGLPLFDAVSDHVGWLVIDYFQGASSHAADLYITRDGGHTWDNLLLQSYPFSSISGIDFVDDQTGWITGGNGPGFLPPYQLWRTRNGGLSWQGQPYYPRADEDAPLENCSFESPTARSYFSGQVVSVCRQPVNDQPALSYYALRTEDGGESWARDRRAGYPRRLTPDLWWFQSEIREYQSEQVRWKIFRYEAGEGATQVGEVDWQGELQFIDERHGWARLEDGSLMASDDGGQQWEALAARLKPGEAPPGDTTLRLDLPAVAQPISAGEAGAIELMGTMKVGSPSTLTFAGRNLFVGTATGKLALWRGEGRIPARLPLFQVGSDWIYQVAVDEQGGWAGAASKDGRGYIFNAYSVDQLEILPEHPGEVSAMAFLASGGRVATGDQAGTIRIWQRSAESGWQVAQQWDGQSGWIWGMASDPATGLLAVAGVDGRVRLWNPDAGQMAVPLAGPGPAVSALAMGPAGEVLAEANRSGELRLWRPQGPPAIADLAGHTAWIQGLAFSPDGTLLASADRSGQVNLWQVASGELLHRWQAHAGPIFGLDFNSDGSLLATAGDPGEVKLWGLAP